MQLSARSRRRHPSALILACAVLLLVFSRDSSVRADDGVHLGVNYFTEPAKDSGLHVVHPQFKYTQDYTSHFGLDLGYDADIVTGATPQVFGSDIVTGATKFEDVRHNGSGAVRFISDYATLSVGGGFAGENDYRSATVSVGASTELFNRNTTLAISYSHNFDKVCDAANSENQELTERNALSSSENCFGDSVVVTERPLAIDSVQASWTQVVTPWLLAQMGVSGQLLDGFQSNPYRQVQLGPQAVQEHVPDVRNRFAYFARGKFALKPIKGSIEASLRGYADSWAIESFTGELSWDQYLTRTLSLRLRGRYYIQDSALFYNDGNQYRQGGAAGSYWTGDRELSALQNISAGAKITWRWRAKEKPLLRFIDAVVLAAKADLLFYHSRTETPEESPNYERTSGVIDALLISANAGFDF